MKVLRAILAALFVFAPLTAGCNRKPAEQQQAGAASPLPSPAAEAVPHQTGAAGSQSLDARALFERGLEAYRDDRDAEAIESFKQAVALDPNFAEAHYRLGLAYNVTKQTEEADKAFEEAARLYEKITRREPKNSDAHFFLGLCYEQIGKYDEAVKALKEAVKNSPQENDDKYYELASAHFKIAQYDESVKALRKTLEINPDHFPAQELLEQAKSGARRIEEFRKRQEQLRKQQGGNSNAGAGNANAGANVNAPARPSSNTATAPPA